MTIAPDEPIPTPAEEDPDDTGGGAIEMPPVTEPGVEADTYRKQG